MCEVAPESAHHSGLGVRVLVVSEMFKTLALIADSVGLLALALLAEAVELKEVDPLVLLPLYLLDLALALSCCWLAFLEKQLSSAWPGLSHHPQTTAEVGLVLMKLAATGGSDSVKQWTEEVDHKWGKHK